jgi:twitching motility protein PilT
MPSTLPMSAPHSDEVFRAILTAAVRANASDIHLKPGGTVMFRIDGELIPVESSVPTEAWLRMVIRSILPSHLTAQFEHDHEVDFAFNDQHLGRFRANAFVQRGHPTLSLRIVKSTVQSLDELNLPSQAKRLAEAPRGVVILAGATGSGKSTTLAALVEHINQTSRKHIITIEDPIEFLFTDRESVIEQREVGLDTASYAVGLRHVLRQDPDVIVVGEMRDAESARAAMGAANIGRLVFTTLHTSDAVQSVHRILEFFPTNERDFARRLLAETLQGVICQRLVRSEASGVFPAVEILFNTQSIGRLIADDQLDKVRGAMELGGADGMQTFDQHLAAMVKEGRIDRDEAINQAANPDMLRMAFQGVVVNEGQRILQSRS